jgi:catechol 2,3-dioxygenase-like lactoylglutathione lyase family enzyme
METPRLVAIDDVRLAAPPDLATQVAEFYTTVIGLQMVAPRPEEPTLVFRGYSSAKPRLRILLTTAPPPGLRGHVQVQVAALEPVQDLVADRGLEAWTTQNLSFFDRRLRILDPAGNRVELVAYHLL